MTARSRTLTTCAVAALAAAALAACSGCDELRRLISPPEPPSVVLIVIDTLRPDHLEPYGYERDTSPTLSRLAGESLVFENAFSAGPKTIPSVPQLLTSSHFPAAREAMSAMQFARESGYENSIAIANNPWVERWLNTHTEKFGDTQTGEFNATEIVERANAWLDAAPPAAPVFMYLHFLDTHTPYQAPPPFQSLYVDAEYSGPIGLEFRDVAAAWEGRFDAQDQQRITDLYDGTIAYVDDALGPFFANLRRTGRFENALIVVTSDHGEEFWDHGSFFHGQSLYDELIRVPLIVKLPLSGESRVATELASTVDILPTIAAAANNAKRRNEAVSDPAWIGRDLATIGDNERDAIFATVGRADRSRPPRHAVRTRDHKLIVNLEDGTRELYELSTDRLERRNVHALGSEIPTPLWEAYYESVADLATAGMQIEIANRGERKVSYEISLTPTPAVPLANLHRVNAERSERIEIVGRSEGLVWRGRLPPDDVDRIRLDAVRSDGEFELHVTVDGHALSPDALALGRRRAAAIPAIATFAELEVDPGDIGAGLGDNGPSPVTVAVWRPKPEAGAAAEAPALSEEERARVEALGYIER